MFVNDHKKCTLHSAMCIFYILIVCDFYATENNISIRALRGKQVFYHGFCILFDGYAGRTALVGVEIENFYSVLHRGFLCCGGLATCHQCAAQNHHKKTFLHNYNILIFMWLFVIRKTTNIYGKKKSC